MKKRLFLESDFLHDDELRSVKRGVYCILKDLGEEFNKEDVFDTVIDYAWHKLDEVFEAVKSHDQVFADTSLMPLISGHYSGAPVIFNEMMKRVIEEGVEGKEVFILRPYDDMHMDEDFIDLDLIPQAFKNNKLFFYTDSYESVIELKDIKK